MKLWGMIFFIYLLIGGACSTLNHDLGVAWEGDTQNVTTSAAGLIQSTQVLSSVGSLSIINTIADFWHSLYSAAIMDFPYIKTHYPEVYHFILFPLAMMGIMSIVVMFIGVIRGNISWT